MEIAHDLKRCNPYEWWHATDKVMLGHSNIHVTKEEHLRDCLVGVNQEREREKDFLTPNPLGVCWYFLSLPFNTFLFRVLLSCKHHSLVTTPPWDLITTALGFHISTSWSPPTYIHTRHHQPNSHHHWTSAPLLAHLCLHHSTIATTRGPSFLHHRYHQNSHPQQHFTSPLTFRPHRQPAASPPSQPTYPLTLLKTLKMNHTATKSSLKHQCTAKRTVHIAPTTSEI